MNFLKRRMAKRLQKKLLASLPADVAALEKTHFIIPFPPPFREELGKFQLGLQAANVQYRCLSYERFPIGKTTYVCVPERLVSKQRLAELGAITL